METIGFIGLGNMGSGMAGNIQKAGYPLVVYDAREEATKNFLEKGARVVTTAVEVARLSDIVLTCLPGPVEVEQVAIGPQGILEGIKPGGIYVDLSTNSPTLIRKIDVMFRQKGAYVLDAPISGNKPGAATGNLAVMVGGEREIYERIKPLLNSFGDKVIYCGGIGAGTICKLVHSMISLVVREAIAEGLTLGVKAGVETRTLWEAVRRGSLGRMAILHWRIPSTALRGKFEPADFSLALGMKDAELATQMGRDFNVPLPLANLAKQTLIRAMNRGWGHKDLCVTFLLQEESAGVQVRAEDIDLEKAAKLVTFNPDEIE